MVLGRKGTTRIDDLHRVIGEIRQGAPRFAGVVMNEF